MLEGGTNIDEVVSKVLGGYNMGLNALRHKLHYPRRTPGFLTLSITRLHLPHAIVVRLRLHKTNVTMARSFGV